MHFPPWFGLLVAQEFNILLYEYEFCCLVSCDTNTYCFTAHDPWCLNSGRDCCFVQQHISCERVLKEKHIVRMVRLSKAQHLRRPNHSSIHDVIHDFQSAAFTMATAQHSRRSQFTAHSIQAWAIPSKGKASTWFRVALRAQQYPEKSFSN